MRYLSLFSGIEACTAAWEPLGWEPVAFAQHDPEHDYSRGPDFPSAVLAHHYPHVPNLGDVTRIDEADIACLGPIDVVVGGSPCQDLSVAGNRAGLAGARSGLFFDQLRIFQHAHRHCGARYLLWENVPGAFSSNAGRDFAVVVGGMAGLDAELAVPPKGWGTEGVVLGPQGLVEWAVLDAQWFGLAQRRRRVFALLDTGDWTRRPPILLEPTRLRGDREPGRAPRQDAAAGAGAGAAGSGVERSGLIDCTPAGITGTVSSKWVKGTGGPAGDEHYNLVVPSFDWPQEVADPVVVVGENKTWTHEGTTFRTRNVVPSVVLSFRENQRGEVDLVGGDGATTHALSGGGGKPGQGYPAIAHSIRTANTSSNGWGAQEEVTHALDCTAGPAVHQAMQVRRLTPRECERLQGFSDDYTLITYRGKPAADGNRYKALGNSMAVPVMRWIANAIDDANLF